MARPELYETETGTCVDLRSVCCVGGTQPFDNGEGVGYKLITLGGPVIIGWYYSEIFEEINAKSDAEKIELMKSRRSTPSDIAKVIAAERAVASRQALLACWKQHV